MTSITDRRQHTRYPANHLDILARSSNDLNQPWALGEIVAIDFNRYGIALESTQQFAVGELLSLIIYTDDGMATRSMGKVCHRTTCDIGFRYGVQFDYNNGNSEIDSTLEAELTRLEQTINRAMPAD